MIRPKKKQREEELRAISKAIANQKKNITAAIMKRITVPIPSHAMRKLLNYNCQKMPQSKHNTKWSLGARSPRKKSE